ncbi:hypothetical protein F5144DRAFT_127536 [Chaetomium tenue]|uniref:Uncharacterized protein n=1 Tax=Chaetomium tenue TaxID=1854479 RepID=A0ACB7PH75_9PEZI|nr:hypothetical protein F5144DRAFT_127536 [Chaetomium globosum]
MAQVPLLLVLSPTIQAFRRGALEPSRFSCALGGHPGTLRYRADGLSAPFGPSCAQPFGRAARVVKGPASAPHPPCHPDVSKLGRAALFWGSAAPIWLARSP